MATVNRYTNISTPRYTPRTLQEMMMVPAYKREQHNNIDLGIAESNAALAQADGMALHDPAMKAEQDRLYNSLQEQAAKLEEEGFSQASKSNFLNFNADYQKSIGPKGKLGMIGAAKTAFETERANIIANATAQGYGADQVQMQLDKAFENYKTKYKKDGIVENFQGPMAPKYEDLDDDILKFGTAMGAEALTIAKAKGYSITPDEKSGMLVMRTPTGTIVETSNDKNLQDAMDTLNSKWLKPGGEGTASAEWQSLTPERITERINSGLGLQRQYSKIDNIQDRYQFTAIPEAQTGDNGEPLTFINTKVKGFNAASIDPMSILNATDKVQGLTFEGGNLVQGATQFATYEDKVDYYKNQPLTAVEYNKETGLHETIKYDSKRDKMVVTPIYKEGIHIAKNLTDLRKDNPFLVELNDQDLIEKLQNFKENLSTNYVEVDIPQGANYEWTNELLFGNNAGSGEKTTGTVTGQRLVTIDGRQLTMDQVSSQLGYNSFDEFVTSGKVGVQGFVAATGTWEATATDEDGNPVSIFIEPNEQIKAAVTDLTTATTGLMEGKSIINLGASEAYEGYYQYIANDFSNNPLVVFSKDPNITKVSDLVTYSPHFGKTLGKMQPKDPGRGDFGGSYSQFVEGQMAALHTNPYYISSSGIGATSKNKR
jgi:hypothetical protein